MVHQLNNAISSPQDPFQFAYRQGRSTEDAVVTLVHLIFRHLDKSNSYARALFIDFSSAFNTIQPDLLLTKMVQLQINPFIIQFYHTFLTNRIQHVKVNKTHSSLEGCISSLVLFTLYTADCNTCEPNQFLSSEIFG